LRHFGLPAVTVPGEIEVIKDEEALTDGDGVPDGVPGVVGNTEGEPQPSSHTSNKLPSRRVPMRDIEPPHCHLLEPGNELKVVLQLKHIRETPVVHLGFPDGDYRLNLNLATCEPE
jgi:hypothetical protein